MASSVQRVVVLIQENRRRARTRPGRATSEAKLRYGRRPPPTGPTRRRPDALDRAEADFERDFGLSSPRVTRGEDVGEPADVRGKVRLGSTGGNSG
jgi:hypothetical protein